MYLHGHFYNQKDERIEVHILTKGDRTKEVVIGKKGGELSFTGDPVELTSEVNDTSDHLLCQQAKVRLLTRNFVPDFFCASCLDAVVNIYREGKCLFAGYIEPQSYSQGYNEEYDEIELSCIDALIALQYSRYRDVGALGVLYNVVKAEAEQRTFLEMLKEIMGGVTAGLDIVGGNAVRYLYDGSKAVDDLTGNRYAIFGQLTINELLFLGDEEDDVWQQDEVLEEMLKYLNLHIVQDGFTFYIYSWESVKGGGAHLLARPADWGERDDGTADDGHTDGHRDGHGHDHQRGRGVQQAAADGEGGEHGERDRESAGRRSAEKPVQELPEIHDGIQQRRRGLDGDRCL